MSGNPNDYKRSDYAVSIVPFHRNTPVSKVTSFGVGPPEQSRRQTPDHLDSFAYYLTRANSFHQGQPVSVYPEAAGMNRNYLGAEPDHIR
jgi:hypothetical protein